MTLRTTLRAGAVIIAVAAGAFALSGSAGGGVPKGPQIAYMSMQDGEADIYTMEFSGLTPPANLTHDKLIGQRQDVEPAWSPDGQYVAFQRNFAISATQPAGSGIFYVTSDGKKLGRLVPPAARDGVFDMHPTWSPDGRYVVFSSNRDGNFELYAVKIGSPRIAKLTNTKAGLANIQPAWSPTGDSIAFVRRGGALADSSALFVLRFSTGHVSRLTKPYSRLGDREPAWSPNGRQIAFTSDRYGSDDIYVVNASGTGLTRLITKGSVDSHPSWSPRGDMLALVSDRSGATEIYVLKLSNDGETLMQLTSDGAFKSNPAWERVASATD